MRLFSFLFLSGFLLMPLAAREPKDVAALLKSGRALPPSEAARLEELVAADPSRDDARIRLLAYYASPAGLAQPEVARKARIPHILWLIENDPLQGGGLFQPAAGLQRVHCAGDALADPAACLQVKEAWLRQYAKHQTDAGVRARTVEALQFIDPEAAEALLTAAADKAGLGRLYGAAIVGVSATAYHENEPSGCREELRATPFAAKAKAALENTSEKSIIGAAAVEFLRAAAVLYADGKLTWDYSDYGARLLVRARAADPDLLPLWALDARLPGSGERPAAILRVNGKEQQKLVLSSQPPEYPRQALRDRVSADVQVEALIAPDGHVVRVSPLNGPSQFFAPTLDCVRYWRYRPTKLDGKPAYVLTDVTVHYRVH